MYAPGANYSNSGVITFQYPVAYDAELQQAVYSNENSLVTYPATVRYFITTNPNPGVAPLYNADYSVGQRYTNWPCRVVTPLK